LQLQSIKAVCLTAIGHQVLRWLRLIESSSHPRRLVSLAVAVASGCRQLSRR
jgi:hypothetical protein